MVRGEALDQNCPNVRLHDPRCRSHPLHHADWRLSLRHQLANSLDDGVVPLGTQGSRGVAFQVTLLAFGYTFFAKATVSEFVVDLKNETSMYRKLKPLQGLTIPVHLGAIDLGRPYYYDVRVRLVHMVFLSWGGEPIGRESPPPASPVDMQQKLVAQTQQLHALGVVHRDIGRQNVLWCSENDGPMLIDFERSEVLEPLRYPRVQALIKQRRSENDPDRRKKRVQHVDSRKFLLREDLFAAKSVFRV